MIHTWSVVDSCIVLLLMNSLKRFAQGLGPYSTSIKKAEKEIKEMAKKINDLCGLLLIPAFVSRLLLIVIFILFILKCPLLSY